MLELICRTVGPWSMNAYVLVCPETRHSALIDPGAEPETLQEMVAGSQPQAILITHCHPDHIGALKNMQGILNVPVMAHPGNDSKTSPIDADRWLKHGDEVPLGRYLLKIYHTPGHTSDQICLSVRDDNKMIVGDTIFPGGPGKTWSPGDFKQTLIALRDTVLTWPDETICYPGHGPAFRLGDKRMAIERFLKKDHGDFFGDATWDGL